jgi:GPH family glycoside/pentoside/hexuronide:cation symporter
MMLYVWQLTSQQISLYPAGLAFSVLGAFLLVSPLHRRFGKRDSAIAGIIISAIITALTYTARNLGLWPELGTNFAAALLLLLFTSALLGQIITTISASSMIAEIVEDHEASHGERCEGMFFAGYFMVQKFGQALGIFAVGQMIAWAGLGGQISPADLPPHIADNMGWAFVGIVLVLGIGAAFALQHYRINRSDHEARVAAIAAKKISPNQ